MNNLPRHYIGIYLLVVMLVAIALMSLSSCSKSGKRLPQQQQRKESVHTFCVVDTFSSYYVIDEKRYSCTFVDLMFIHEDGNSIRRIYLEDLTNPNEVAFFRYAEKHKGDTLRMHVP